jgi:hypothetical protein
LKPSPAKPKPGFVPQPRHITITSDDFLGPRALIVGNLIAKLLMNQIFA